MLFRQRNRTSNVERAKLWLWPRVSWRRSTLYYIKRILRLSATPYSIAAGCAAGAAISFTPFIGFHIALSVAIAWLIRGNLIAAAIGTSVGNPLTFPLIWASTYRLGHVLVAGAPPEVEPELGHHFLERSIENVSPIIKMMSVGSLPLGFLCALVVYAIVYKSVAAYQENRRRSLARGRKVKAAATTEKSVHSQA